MTNTKIHSIAFMRNTIPLFFVYAFVLFSGFSNTPGYLHNALTIPTILSFCIIIVSPFYKVKSKVLFFLAFLAFLALIGSYFSTPFPKIFKTYSHSVAYIWLLLFLVSAFLAGGSPNVKLRTLRRMLIIGLGITVLYELVESYIHFLDVDLGSYLPRVARESYRIPSGFGFFRARAFNYESAYLAMYLNVGFALLLAVSKKYKLGIILIWITALIHTMSLTQMLLLLFVMLVIIVIRVRKIPEIIFKNSPVILLTFKSNRMPKYYLSIVVLLGVIMILFFTNFSYWVSWFDALKEWYIVNLTGLTPSGKARLISYQLGLGIISDSWPFGIGVGGIQALGLKGMTSFYLSMLVEMGVYSFFYFLIITFFFYRSLMTKNIWIVSSFFFAWIHLLTIDTFYLPQIFLPIIFTEAYIASKCNGNQI